jgi:hypothetical protein
MLPTEELRTPGRSTRCVAIHEFSGLAKLERVTEALEFAARIKNPYLQANAIGKVASVRGEAGNRIPQRVPALRKFLSSVVFGAANISDDAPASQILP